LCSILEETVIIEARDPQNKELAETYIDRSISILNCMTESITGVTSEEEIEILYESVEEVICENEEVVKTSAFDQFYEALDKKIKIYVDLKNNKMRILRRFLRFTLTLNKSYGAKLVSSPGSVLLKLAFTSERGYDLYMQDLERGEIGKQIMSVLLYPPYLANFNLEYEDLMIYLNGTEITGKIST
jgi:hypothetical protein